jgi:hypothetical protein
MTKPEKLPLFYAEHYEFLTGWLRKQPENLTKTSVALTLADELEKDNAKFIREKWLRKLNIANNVRYIGEKNLNK